MSQKFHMTIGAVPQANTDYKSLVQHDVELVKVALLYSDYVTLCSPISWFCASLIRFRHFSNRQFIDLTELLIPTLTNGRSQLHIENAILAIETMRRLSDKKQLTKEDLLLRRGLDSIVNSMKSDLNKRAEDLAEDFGISQVAPALERGLLKIENLGPEKSSVEIVADLLQHSQNASNDFSQHLTELILTDFIDKLHEMVKNHAAYPLFDAQAGKFIQTGIEAGQFVISDSQNTRAKHVGLANSLIQRLPLFENASVKDVLDIRKELRKPLVRFRGAMLQFSKDIRSSAWEDDFPIEVENVFRKEVEVAIMEIEDALKSNKYLFELMKKVLSPAVFIPSGASALGLVVSNYSSVPEVTASFLGVTLGTGILASDAYREWKSEQSKIESNQLFFYYKAQEHLARL